MTGPTQRANHSIQLETLKQLKPESLDVDIGVKQTPSMSVSRQAGAGACGGKTMTSTQHEFPFGSWFAKCTASASAQSWPIPEDWHQAPRRGVRAGGRHALTRFVDLVLGWHERACQRRALLGLDDRMLRDIGVSRAAAMAESQKPFWRL
jgi:uncharacterized protein YjiS (DUF1127 family)